MPDPGAIICRPRVTEKSHILAERRSTYVFEVAIRATKDEIRSAIERMFADRNIHVTKVRTLVQRGKARRYRRTWGRTSTFKKAFVTLRSGETLDVI